MKCPISGKTIVPQVNKDGSCQFISEKGGWYSKVFDDAVEAIDWFRGLDMGASLDRCEEKPVPRGIKLISPDGWMTSAFTVEGLDAFKAAVKKIHDEKVAIKIASEKKAAAEKAAAEKAAAEKAKQEKKDPPAKK